MIDRLFENLKIAKNNLATTKVTSSTKKEEKETHVFMLEEPTFYLEPCLELKEEKPARSKAISEIKSTSSFSNSTREEMVSFTPAHLASEYRSEKMSANDIANYLVKSFSDLKSTAACALNEFTDTEREKLFSEWHEKLSPPLFTQLYFYFQPAHKWKEEWKKLLDTAIDTSLLIHPRVFQVVKIKQKMVQATPDYSVLKTLLMKQNAHFNFEEFNFIEFSGFSLHRRAIPRTNFKNAKLPGKDLSFADLGESDLRGADISKADMWGTDFRGAMLDVNVMLQIVKYIQTFRFETRDEPHYFSSMMMCLKNMVLGKCDSDWINNNKDLVKLIIHALPLMAATNLKKASECWSVLQVALENKIPEEFFRTFKSALAMLGVRERELKAKQTSRLFYHGGEAVRVEQMGAAKQAGFSLRQLLPGS